MKISAKRQLWTAIIVVVFMAIFCFPLEYLLQPSKNFHSWDLWAFVWIVLALTTACTFITSAILKKVWDMYGEDESYGIKDWFKHFFTRNMVPHIFLLLLVLWSIIFFATGIPAWKCFNADEYASLISVQEGNFAEDVIEIGSDDIVIVDVKTAQRLGDRTIGSLQNSGWFEADNEYNLISIGGELYRISSLNYGDWFKYNKANVNGIPGYILVNAKTQEAKLVELEQGMKYSPSAFWSYDLNRHLHNLYPSYMFGQSFFEVDDEYKPYWITGVGEAQIGLRGAAMITSVLITDAITGETQEYSFDDLPDWVDHVNSVSYIMTLIKYHYRYQNGWWNPSETNVYRTSYYYKDSSDKKDDNEFTPFDGYNSVVGKDGKIWFYTGLTPANAAETNVGFLLISPKDGEVRHYEITGAEEASAQKAAEGLVQNLHYSAGFPTIVNVDGIETYFMLLKDDAGLVQRYSLCNVKQYSKVVQGETLEETIENYRIKMGLETETVPEEASKEPEQQEPERVVFTATGVVDEVAQAQIDGYTFYYFTLEGENSVFMSSIQNNNLQPLKLVSGANVEVKYYISSNEEVQIVTEIQIK